VVHCPTNLGMDLEEEDDVARFLGVLIRRHSSTDPTIELLQTGLIQRIVDALQISHPPSKRTPAKLGVLGSDPKGDQPNSTFNYASVLGMMGYLQANSRPDITFCSGLNGILNTRLDLFDISLSDVIVFYTS
jgi:hypothetical protein